MSRYTLHVDGQSRSREMLNVMLRSFYQPKDIAIVGLVDKEHPKSKALYIEKKEGEGLYNFTTKDVSFAADGIHEVTEYVQQYSLDAVDTTLDIIDNFFNWYMPDAIAVNAPPLRNANENLPNFNLMMATYKEREAKKAEREAQFNEIVASIDRSTLPVYYVGLLPNSIEYRDNYMPRYEPAYIPLYNEDNNSIIGEFHTGLVYKVNPKGGLLGFPEKPVGQWKHGLPPGVNQGAQLGFSAEPGAQLGFSAEPGAQLGFSAEPGAQLGFSAEPGAQLGFSAEPGNKKGGRRRSLRRSSLRRSRRSLRRSRRSLRRRH